MVFHFSFARTKEKRNKKKTRRLPFRSKKFPPFPKRKELASLKQLFVLHGNEGNFLYASPLNAGTSTPTSTSKAMLRQNLRPHFLSVKWKERYGALKWKSCLSEASSFPLAEYPTGIAQKVQTAVFLFCYLFSFCCQKEKSKKQTITKKILPLHKQKKKTCIKKQSITI